ncbi:hypothetical protein WICPIJ_006983 [Wickerhamomyces pijperi]|uniref:Isocitrate lyase n=1 Tax=Wickerhamomyces pijperi TaxID=599730 RepID=A0A9P8Q2S5_WICPI|nr:hypothetical protein WICPIJ_006983 [Wickerhamomyces pijperi]
MSTPAAIKNYLQTTLHQLEGFLNSPRFKNIKRPYQAADLVKFKGTLPIEYPSSHQSKKLLKLLNENFTQRTPVHTLGVTDPVQLTQLGDIEVVYVSGWACSSLLTATNEVGPDIGDYTYNTVPNQVERLFKAQLHHDRKALYNHQVQGDEKMVDYLKPIIADADTGHGGNSTVMKLTKLFVEKGASAIHFEDQLHGAKKCGHLSGKVLVPTSTHVQRLIASRLQMDIMGVENLIIARTDSESATLLSSDIDPRDHDVILGVRDDLSKVVPLSEALARAELQGKSSTEIADLELDWLAENKLYTFDELVKIILQEKSLFDEELYQEYRLQSQHRSINDRKDILNELLSLDTELSIPFNHYAPRTREGYFLIRPTLDNAIERSLSFAPYADLLWLETKTPDLQVAKDFSSRIHAVYPHMKLVYNLSPSFNWSAQGFNETQLKDFIWELAKLGFTLQLVSLAGLHSNGVSFAELAEGYLVNGMKSYVDLVQSKEKQLNVDLLKHQAWSGIGYADGVLELINNGGGSMSSSTGGEGNTETQF